MHRLSSRVPGTWLVPPSQRQKKIVPEEENGTKTQRMSRKNNVFAKKSYDGSKGVDSSLKGVYSGGDASKENKTTNLNVVVNDCRKIRKARKSVVVVGKYAELSKSLGNSIILSEKDELLNPVSASIFTVSADARVAVAALFHRFCTGRGAPGCPYRRIGTL